MLAKAAHMTFGENFFLSADPMTFLSIKQYENETNSGRQWLGDNKSHKIHCKIRAIEITL
jgi:hypothetical protein